VRAAARGLLLLLALLATPVVAQRRDPASPLLPPSHWALAALGRLDALGLAGGGYDPGAGSVTRAEAARRLEAAATLAQDRPEVERLVAGYRLRLAEESGSLHAGAARLEGGFAGDRGALLTGYDRDELHVAPAARGGESAPYLAGTVEARLTPRLAVALSPRVAGDSLRLESGYLAAAGGGWRGWAGRRRVGFGAAADGSLVLGSEVAFDGVGIARDSTRLPGPLGALGPFRFEAFGSRLHAAGAVDDPWFLALRLWARPHPRLWIAGTRAAAIGGRGNTPVRWTDSPALLVGLASGVHGETENQVASLEARWRPPMGALPLVVYGEWAVDDFGWAFVHVPGVTTGVELPALPSLPAVSLGVERTGFAAHCCGYPLWYRHSALPWIDRRVPLGHPLGGNGTEWLAHAGAELLDARLRLDGRAFLRERGPDNLFAPARRGRSRGGAFSAEWSVGPRLEAFGSAEVEDGRGWRASTVRAGVRVRY